MRFLMGVVIGAVAVAGVAVWQAERSRRENEARPSAADEARARAEQPLREPAFMSP